MKKILLIIILLLLSFTLVSCEQPIGEVALPYYNEEGEADYNRDIFYRNDLLQGGADPTVIYVTEGEYSGYFFIYGSYGGCTNYAAYKSKDCITWEFESICFEPEEAIMVDMIVD